MNWKEITSRQTISASSATSRLATFLDELNNVISLSAFRRLQDKAQVFPLKTGDFVRTRLTHSIEVMSTAEEIGEGIAEKLKEKTLKKFINTMSTAKNKQETIKIVGDYRDEVETIESIPKILKPASILHDMGNPPFGHIGEEIISNWFKTNLKTFYVDFKKQTLTSILRESEIIDFELKKDKYKKVTEVLTSKQRVDLENFEGNAQLFRIMLKLNNYNKEFSAAVLGACMKYTCSSANRPSAKKVSKVWEKKIGYFLSEEECALKVFSILNSNGDRSPLAFLLEASDDISYLLSDIEDAIKKGLISFDSDIFEKIKKVSRNAKSINILNAFNELEKKHLKSISEAEQISAFKRIYRSHLIIDAINTFINNENSILSGSFYYELLEKGEFASIVDYFRKLLKNKVYHSKIIAIEKAKVHKILNALLDSFVPAAFYVLKTNSDKGESKNQMICELFSEDYKKTCKSELAKIYSDISLSKSEKRSKMFYTVFRLAVDEVSGMTDYYALHMYEIINAIKN